MRVRFVVIALGALLLSCPAWSQTNLGRILGAVTDQSGSAVSGATVTVTDVARGTSRKLTADDAGAYAVPGLVPGTYTVRAEAMGFTTIERKDIIVEVGQDVRVDLTLQVGSQQQVITVSGEAPMVNTSSATMGGVIENQPLAELPVSGRNYLFLLQLSHPGIQTIPGGGPNSYNTSGIRQSGQNYMFDGLFDSNIFTSALIVGGTNGGGGPDQANLLPLDAIQEVNVTLNPKVEYGWKAGAVINVGLKSGTNSIHGTAYAFGSDDALDARNPFLTSAQPKQSVDLEQFGASFGGPIKKDKIFYFGSYEGQRYSVVAPRTAQAPTTQLLAGNTTNSLPAAIADMESVANGYCNPAAAGCTKPISQLSLNMAGCILPAGLTGAATCTAANGLFGNSTSSNNIVSNYPTSGGSNNFIVKMDDNINEHNTLHGEYYNGAGTFDAQTASLDQQYWEFNLHSGSQVVRVVWAWIPNSAWVNEARFGYDRIYQWSLPIDCSPGINGAPNYATMGFVTGVQTNSQDCGLPPITIKNFTAIGGAPGGYSSGQYPQGVDSVSYTRGKHLIKFGGEFRLNDYNTFNAGGLKGTLSFGTTTNAFTGATPLEDFLSGTLSSTGGTLTVGNPERTVTWQSYAGFIQDDWRIIPKVTLNLGLRYEVETPIFHDINNQLGNFSPSVGLVQQSAGSSLTNTDYHNFMPRLGVAWDVTGKGVTVVRGGVGVYPGYAHAQYEFGTITPYLTPTGALLYSASGQLLPGPANGNINTGSLSIPGASLTPNWQANNTVLGTPIFGTLPTTSQLKCGNGISGNPSPCTIGAVDPNLKPAHNAEWNLSIQHAFTSSLTWEVAYVGNHAWDLWFVKDINQPSPSNAGGASAEQQARPYYSQYPYLGQIKWLNDQDTSNFSALESTLTQRVAHSLSFTASYTYGHALDDASLDGANTPQIIQDSTNPKSEYGNAQFDIRHRFTFTGTYIVPGRKAPGQMLEGWEVNTSVNLESGIAYNPYDTTSDINNTGEADSRWDLVGKASDFNGFGGTTPFPCYGILGSSFAPTATPSTGCKVVTLTSMPAACYNGASGLAGNPNVVGSSGIASLEKLGCYAVGNSAIIPPAAGTFGTMSRYELRGQPIHIWDLSLDKNWKINERISTQFRAEFFNILNIRSFNIPVPGTNNDSPNAPGTFGASAGTPDVVVNSPVIGSGSPRKIQFGLKFIF